VTYALQSDLALAIPPETLLRLSADDPMATVPDAGVVAEMLAAASSEIDAALADGGLLLPDPVPAVIKHLCVALTRCRLYARRPEGMDFPDAVRRECDAARKMLASIAAGELRLGAVSPAGSPKAAAPGRVFAGGEF
jgi:phage gp36-like protein